MTITPRWRRRWRHADAFIASSSSIATILDPLLAAGLKADRRVEFIHDAIVELDQGLRRHGASLVVLHAPAAEAIPRLASDLDVDAVFASEDYEPYARERDAAVERALAAHDRRFVRCKDHVIFEKSEVVTGSGRPFSVFTPYKNAWLRRLTADDLAPRDSIAGRERLASPPDCSAIPRSRASDSRAPIWRN